MQFGDFVIELFEDGAEGAWQLIVLGEQGGPVGPEDAEIELGIEEGDLEAIAGGGIPVGLRDAMNDALEAEASQVVGHLRRGVRATEECLDLGAKVTIAKPTGKMGKCRDRLKECHHPGIAEAQRGDALTGFDGRLLQSVERVLGQDAMVT